MGEPKFDLTFEWGHDLNDVSHNIRDSERVDKICPVCGSENIYCSVDGESDDFDTITNHYICGDCNSEFSYTWWIGNVYVYKQGRVEDKEEE